MTSMDICVLQKNDELWCGQSNTQGINLLAAALKPETATVDEMFAAVKERKYPWGFSWKAGTKMMRKDAKPEDLDFHQIAGFPLKYASPSDVFAIASEGALIIDLQNKKLIHLDHRSPEGAPFPAVLGVWLSGDSVANKKFSECEKNMKAEGREKETWGPSNPCNKFILKTRPAPAGFMASTITLDYIPEGERYSKSDEKAAKNLLDDLRACNHESGEFFRSLGSCAGRRVSSVIIPTIKPRQRKK